METIHFEQFKKMLVFASVSCNQCNFQFFFGFQSTAPKSLSLARWCFVNEFILYHIRLICWCRIIRFWTLKYFVTYFWFHLKHTHTQCAFSCKQIDVLDFSGNVQIKLNGLRPKMNYMPPKYLWIVIGLGCEETPN